MCPRCCLHALKLGQGSRLPLPTPHAWGRPSIRSSASKVRLFTLSCTGRRRLQHTKLETSHLSCSLSTTLQVVSDQPHVHVYWLRGETGEQKNLFSNTFPYTTKHAVVLSIRQRPASSERRIRVQMGFPLMN